MLGPLAQGKSHEITQYAPRPAVSAPPVRASRKVAALWLEKPYLEPRTGALARVGGDVVSVGGMLAQARVAAGMSIEDLAYKSKLRATIIAAIESDDFSLCGGEVYARGQVRSLSVIVGLDPNEVMHAYDARSGLNSPPA